MFLVVLTQLSQIVKNIWIWTLYGNIMHYETCIGCSYHRASPVFRGA